MFIGAEIGKNLRSPLNTAEGNAVARALAGTSLRFNYPLNEDEGREINWTTVYTRRWLFKDEIGFDTDKDGKLFLTRFGKSPRDFVESKFSYGAAKFFDVVVTYQWGEFRRHTNWLTIASNSVSLSNANQLWSRTRTAFTGSDVAISGE